MKKGNSLVIVIALLVSGCISTHSAKTDDSNESRLTYLDENGNYSLENMRLPEYSFPSKVISSLEIIESCSGNDELNVVVNNETNNEEYSRISKDLSSKIMLAWGCGGLLPISIEDDDYYDARASGSGVAISRALFEETDYIDELAFVLAHEIAHYILRHSDELHLVIEKANSVDKNRAVDILNSLHGGNSPLVTSGYVDRAFQLSQNMAPIQKVIQHEITADHIAIDLMVKSGYSPQGVSNVLDKLSSCLGFKDGDLNNKMEELNTAAKSFSEQPELDPNRYIDLLNEVVGMTKSHLPPPWRKQMIFNYIKDQYAKERRRAMTPMS